MFFLITHHLLILFIYYSYDFISIIVNYILYVKFYYMYIMHVCKSDG